MKEEKSSQLLLSVITVTYNNADNLVKTIQSLPLKSNIIEHIVIDGNSTDTTKKILYSDKREYLNYISEPDNGIYDAMNKGLKLAKGQFVIFMNAGDHFVSAQVLNNICKILLSDQPDILYGETILVTEEDKIIGPRSVHTTKTLPTMLTLETLRRGMMVCHQSLIVKRSLCTPYITNNLSSDYDWLLTAALRSNNIKKTDFPISKYLVGGVSKKHHIRSLFDRFKIMIKHYGYIGASWNHLLILKSIIYQSIIKPQSLDYI